MRCAAFPIFLSVASAAVHRVQVGRGSLTFVPETVTAVEGDTVIFELFPGHNVVEGDGSSKPCKADDDGFYAPYTGTDGGKKKFVVNVTSSDPIYYFCSLSGHCQAGMVGGINIPTSGNGTIQAYGQAAASVQEADTPTQVRGGQLLDDAQIASMTGSASAGPTASGSASRSSSARITGTSTASAAASGSGAAAASTAGATDFAPVQISGAMAMVLGIAAWFV